MRCAAMSHKRGRTCDGVHSYVCMDIDRQTFPELTIQCVQYNYNARRMFMLAGSGVIFSCFRQEVAKWNISNWEYQT